MSFAMPPGFHRYHAAAWVRLGVAIVFSTLIHSWLVAGIKTEAGRRAVPPSSGVISATLEPAVPFNQTAVTVISPEAEPEPVAGRDPMTRAKTVAGRQDAAALQQPAVQPRSMSAAPEVPEAPAQGLALPPLPDPVYYPARQLDVYPALLGPINLPYPERAARDEVSGKVTVLLLIDERGMVNDVSVVEAEPAGYFEETTHAVFSGTRFSPARKDGRPVRSRVLISVSYGSAQSRDPAR
jgi:TonB family protein